MEKADEEEQVDRESCRSYFSNVILLVVLNVWKRIVVLMKNPKAVTYLSPKEKSKSGHLS